MKLCDRTYELHHPSRQLSPAFCHLVYKNLDKLKFMNTIGGQKTL